MLMSRSSIIDMCSVRGMGVAVRTNTSANARSSRSRCLCSTPNRCSSSMMTRPKSEKATSLESNRWVPTKTSTSPLAVAFSTDWASSRVRKRLKPSTRKGNPAKRSRNDRRCCSARTVVGTNTATCRPDSTALKAARSATSVLPKPTSPQTKRSIGRALAMSRFTASMAES